MHTVENAEALILGHMRRFDTVCVPLDGAFQGVLRETIVAERDQPPFDRVTMDGVAIAFASWEAGVRRYRVQGTQAAGQAPRPLGDPQACVEIMTGAALPAGADTVVPLERIRFGDGCANIEPEYRVQARQFVHWRGSDRLRGEPLLAPGVVIRGPEMALLASSGQATVRIARRPAIAVIANGNELVEAGRSIEDFQVRSCNDRAIETALRSRGYDAVTRTMLPDDPGILRERIAELHRAHEVLILSGGVSMGKYDYIPEIMEELSIELVLHKISQRPGLPMWFGVSGEGKTVFALPGNPVSSLVCLVRYVLPALEQACGVAEARPRWARLAAPVEFTPKLTYFLPVVLESAQDGVTLAHPRPTNTSGDFVSLGGTDGFVELERDRDQFPAGHVARFRAW
jgi:molybdopterin molybdotransferase